MIIIYYIKENKRKVKFIFEIIKIKGINKNKKLNG
jgi:hypothetical protein